jgi:hypothetical protein
MARLFPVGRNLPRGGLAAAQCLHCRKDDDDKSIRPFKVTESSWLFHFQSMAVAGYERGDFERFFETVTIICFNYDRTIEQFLSHSVQRHAQLEPDEAAAAIARLRIFRPYGALGTLAWQSNAARVIPFGGDYQGEVLRGLAVAAGNIRTFTEQFDDIHLQAAMHLALGEANLIVFPGFGFHKQNMNLLAIGAWPDNSVRAPVYGTGDGLHENEKSLKNAIAEASRVNSQHAYLYPLKVACVSGDLPANDHATGRLCSLFVLDISSGGRETRSSPAGFG